MSAVALAIGSTLVVAGSAVDTAWLQTAAEAASARAASSGGDGPIPSGLLIQDLAQLQADCVGVVQFPIDFCFNDEQALEDALITDKSLVPEGSALYEALDAFLNDVLVMSEGPVPPQLQNDLNAVLSLNVLNSGSSGSGSTSNLASDTESYWMTAADGGVFAEGHAPFLGSIGGHVLNQPVVGMTEDNHSNAGYWEVAADGGVFTYGDAGFYGSAGNLRLNKPVVGMAATPGAAGYDLFASDGGVFTYGDAHFYGSTGGMVLNQPVVGGAVTPDGRGYWEVAADGGVFTFGDAGFYGSAGNMALNQPTVGIVPTPDGHGYTLVAKDGGIFTFGDATFEGTPASTDGDPVSDIVGASALPGGGYVEFEANGASYPFPTTGAQIPTPAINGLVAPVTGGTGYATA